MLLHDKPQPMSFIFGQLFGRWLGSFLEITLGKIVPQTHALLFQAGLKGLHEIFGGRVRRLLLGCFAGFLALGFLLD